jgi:hypothetical protein
VKNKRKLREKKRKGQFNLKKYYRRLGKRVAELEH